MAEKKKTPREKTACLTDVVFSYGYEDEGTAIKYIDKNKVIKQHVYPCPSICQRLNPLFFG